MDYAVYQIHSPKDILCLIMEAKKVAHKRPSDAVAQVCALYTLLGLYLLNALKFCLSLHAGY